ncbi:ferrous iron transport protein B [Bacteriovorax sp. BAL6_X]|uniref:ribosome biogenesis GTPase Der n=1 Tax=Bacteriovorax sp. BAL6_X TaxID=1201290 RepID=UPI000385B0E8|nr:GTPase [Bacteriovorax sp. BAL6_X]EPZ50812.1 ferrous iron transport protein B [Bacteriovorax sp. BAL6_X]
MQKRSMIISLIGRPNVGKSSVFNRLMKKQFKAITHDMPGVTRDRHYGITTFSDADEDRPLDAILVDTGGFYPTQVDENGKNDQEINANKFFNIMTDHAHQAIEESDLVLFVVDVREGVLPFDKTIANFIRKQKKKMWLIVNKFDSSAQDGDEYAFYELGINNDEMFVTSAAHGLGMENLRENIHREMMAFSESNDVMNISALQKGVTPRENVVAKLALIGAPNAGKSTLLNQLLGSERALVSDIAGTTVDPIDGYFDLFLGEDAKKLDEAKAFFKNDNLLRSQYEDFKKNNPDLYNELISSYDLEEEVETELDDYELEGLEDAMLEQDEELDETSVTRMEAQVFGEESNDAGPGEESSEGEAESLLEAEIEGSHWRSIHIVDTAGIRKQKKIDDFVESQSVYRSLRSIADSDVCIYMIDAVKGVSHQDKRLLDIAIEKGASVIVCLNKVDLMGDTFKDQEARKEWLLNIRDKMPWLNYCDIIPISAKHKRGLKRLKKILAKTIFIRRQSIATGALNRFVFELIERHPIILKGSRGKRFRVKYASQIKADPPTFLFYTNKSKGIPENYRRYLKNGLRGAFPLDNTPIHLIFRTGTDLQNRMKKVSK